jgi:type IV pilus assembly protein PilM
MGIYRSGIVRRVSHWLDAIPHPALACEIAPNYVAGARWKHGGKGLEAFAVEPLPEGAIVPSAVESNLADVNAVRAAVGKTLGRLGGGGQEVALFVPDPVIRIFILHFDSFPRSREEALPILQWKLKKSVPFETEETLISYMRQAPRDEGVDIVTALARLRIIREYEMLAESAGLIPAVILSSTLAALPLVDDRQSTLLARVVGSALTTAIVRDGGLLGYRCTELSADSGRLTARGLLDEIFPLTAYFQDTWQDEIRDVRLAGLGERASEFRELLEAELHCPVGPLLQSAVSAGSVPADAQPLCDRELEALVGWMLNRTA